MNFIKPNLGDNACITREVAEAYCRGDLENLCDYEEIDEAGAEVLAAGKRELWLPDVMKVSEEVATILARHNGNLRLDGIIDLKPEIARALARHKGDLALLVTEQLSDESALALADHDGSIELLLLHQLTDQPGHLALAKKLAATEGPLFLIELFVLSLAAAEELAQHKGELTLGLQDASDELAVVLAKHDGKIVFAGECEMSEQARRLLKIKSS